MIMHVAMDVQDNSITGRWINDHKRPQAFKQKNQEKLKLKLKLYMNVVPRSTMNTNGGTDINSEV